MTSETPSTPVLEQLSTDELLNQTEATMSPLQRHWAKVAGIAADLDPQSASYDDQMRRINPAHRHSYLERSTKPIWLCSLRSPTRGTISGRVTQAPPWLAAQLITAETHRVANAAEIAGWEKDQEARKNAAVKLAAERNPQVVPNITVNLPAESVQTIREAARRQSADSSSKQQ